MLEIKAIQTKEEQERICGLCGVEFDPDCLAFGAKETAGETEEDREKLLGVSQFRIIKDFAVIYDLAKSIKSDDFEAVVITGKATLNFIDLCGIKTVFFKTDNKNLPEILGFEKFDKEDNGGDYKYRLNLEGYFDSPCGCKF